jgi:hypothetical protein
MWQTRVQVGANSVRGSPPRLFAHLCFLAWRRRRTGAAAPTTAAASPAGTAATTAAAAAAPAAAAPSTAASTATSAWSLFLNWHRYQCRDADLIKHKTVHGASGESGLAW